MTRRRLIWAITAALVAFTIGMLLGATEARAATPSPPAHDATMTLGAACLLVVGMAALCLLGVGAMRLTDWVWQNRPPSKEERRQAEALQAALDDEAALIEATHECPPNGPCAWCVSKPPVREKTKAELEAEFANHHAMVDRLRGEDRIGRMVREAETDLCELSHLPSRPSDADRWAATARDAGVLTITNPTAKLANADEVAAFMKDALHRHDGEKWGKA